MKLSELVDDPCIGDIVQDFSDETYWSEGYTVYVRCVDYWQPIFIEVNELWEDTDIDEMAEYNIGEDAIYIGNILEAMKPKVAVFAGVTTEDILNCVTQKLLNFRGE